MPLISARRAPIKPLALRGGPRSTGRAGSGGSSGMTASSSPAAAQELASAGGGDGGGFGGPPWGGQAAPLQPLLLPHMIPCACPPLPCYGWLSPPPLSRLLTQPVSPGELLLLPPPPPGPLLCSAFLRPGPAADAPRAKAAASRESTAALKAWLGRHLKNPYPSKGEKALLALLSQMSLTQVSTWFANARRRLKKENRACWPPRPSKAAAGEAGQGEAAQEQGAAPSSSSSTAPPRTKPPSAGSPGSPWLQAVWQGPRPAPAPSGAAPPPTPALARKPKIWCVAELATSPQAGRAAA